MPQTEAPSITHQIDPASLETLPRSSGEQRGDWVQRNRIKGWRHIGTWCSRTDQSSELDQKGFDLDTCKILVKPVMLQTARIELV